jgi:hypothetical protein
MCSRISVGSLVIKGDSHEMPSRSSVSTALKDKSVLSPVLGSCFRCLRSLPISSASY